MSSPSNVDRSPHAADSGTWRLGDRPVHRLGFGAMRLTGTMAFHDGVPRDRDASIAVLRRAVELGVNHVDTAAFYFSAPRSANEIINAALAPFGDEVLVADLDLSDIPVAGQPADRRLARSLRDAGFCYDYRRRRVSRTGPLQAALPYRYLGADDRTGPNYTGQPAVTSHYE